MHSKVSSDSPIIKLPPYHYIHVINLNNHVTRLEIGPQSYICQQNEQVVFGPEKMITVPIMKYCVILNPVIKNSDGHPVCDKNFLVKVRVGDLEYRFTQDPFPLYPGEILKEKVASLPIVAADCALRLKAYTNFEDNEFQRTAGEEWLFEGPGVYYPRKEIEVIKEISSVILGENDAIVLKATRNLVDRNGVSHTCGSKWLIQTPGAYLPGVNEEICEQREAIQLNVHRAICLEAIQSHVDKFSKFRKLGDNWLITHSDADHHICSVNEKFVSFVDITVLNKHQYAVILDAYDDNGMKQLGKRKLVCGPISLFLRPGETLECGVQTAYLLESHEGLMLRAMVDFEDVEAGGSKKIHYAGDKWLIRGPLEYIPPIEVEVVAKRTLIPLDANEGVYVQNTETGHVRAVIGNAYMLQHNEELWKKKMSPEVVRLLQVDRDPLADRGNKCLPLQEDNFDFTRVVTLRIPHNAVVQIYDYKNHKSRIEFGPALAMLGPDEQFTRLSLSAGKPKKTNAIKCLCLLLGPDFCTDIIVVETADHARLSLQLSYNWNFDVPSPCSDTDAAMLFAVPDFIGDACKTIASRIRGTVASVQFDDFHKHSSRIIRASVFGLDEGDKIKSSFTFQQNRLVISNIDVQSVEPVDQRTRDSLQKSVQLAIEITTNSQEATARHEAERLEQEARGRLEKQKIEDEVSIEESKRGLLEVKIQLATFEMAGQAKAEAMSRVESGRIEAEAAIQQAKLRVEAQRIETCAELERLKMAREAELLYTQEKDALSLKLKSQEVELEISRFTSMVNTLGPDTLCAIATAESQHKLNMLSSLGLQSTLITDGSTPVNLLSTAHGLIGSSLSQSKKTE